MHELEKILEEIDEATRQEDAPIYCGSMEVDGYVRMSVVEGIIRKHVIGKDTNVPTNDGWIPVEERLPEEGEWKVYHKQERYVYMKRMEIAYMTDTVEYTHGYYDGYKWIDKRHSAIKNVVAWKIHKPYRPERSEGE